MKKIGLAALLTLASSSAFALSTDYTCSLRDIASGNEVTSCSALISRSHVCAGDEVRMSVSNNFGYNFEVLVSDSSSNNFMSTIDLAGPGYVSGSADKGLRSDFNPKKMVFNFELGSRKLTLICARADNIEYPKD